MKQRGFIRALALALCLALLAGCGGGPAPSSVPASRSACPSPPVDDPVQWENPWGDGGGLEDYRQWAAAQFPEGRVGIAYVGRVEAPLEDLTQEPQANRAWPLVYDIGPLWVFGEIGQAASVWCVAPVDPEALVEVYEDEVLLYAGDDSPVLLLDEEGRAQGRFSVRVTGPDGTVTQLRDNAVEACGLTFPALPEGMDVFDFTAGPGAFVPNWQLCGVWSMADHADWAEGQSSSTNDLVLREDGTAAYQVSDEAGAPQFLYEGTWQRTGGQYLTLALELTEQTVLPREDLQSIWGEYSFAIGYGNELVLEAVRGSTPLGADHPEHPLVFRPQSYAAAPFPLTEGFEARLQLCADAVYAYQCQADGPEQVASAQVICPNWGANYVLVQVCASEPEGRSAAWYLMDPIRLVGNDYLSGAEVDVNPFVSLPEPDGPDSEPAGSNRELVQEALVEFYHSSLGEAPAQARYDREQKYGQQYTLYVQEGETLVPYARYILDPVRFTGYDADTYAPVDLVQPGSTRGNFPGINGYSDRQMCAAVQDYCEAQSGSRPEAVPQGSGPYGRTVQVYEEHPDHRTTLGWYEVEPRTLQAWDVMTGASVDLLPTWRQDEGMTREEKAYAAVRAYFWMTMGADPDLISRMPSLGEASYEFRVEQNGNVELYTIDVDTMTGSSTWEDEIDYSLAW